MWSSHVWINSSAKIEFYKMPLFSCMFYDQKASQGVSKEK